MPSQAGRDELRRLLAAGTNGPWHDAALAVAAVAALPALLDALEEAEAFRDGQRRVEMHLLCEADRLKAERDEAVEWQRTKAEWIDVAERTLNALLARTEKAEAERDAAVARCGELREALEHVRWWVGVHGYLENHGHRRAGERVCDLDCTVLDMIDAALAKGAT